MAKKISTSKKTPVPESIPLATGNIGRVLAARLPSGVDFMSAATKIIRKSRFKSGTIRAIGSMSHATVLCPNHEGVMESRRNIVRGEELEGPIQVGSAMGIFGVDSEGVTVHVHGVFMDRNSRVFCGDLVKGKCKVWLFVDLILEELEGIEFDSKPEAGVGFNRLHPRNSEK